MKEEQQMIQLLRSITSTLSSTLNRDYEPYGLTGVQWMVLMEVGSSEEEVRIGDLAKRLMMSNSNLSAIVKRMAQRDLLVRTRSKEDERIVCVSVSDKANRIIQEMEACVSKQCLLSKDITQQQKQQIIESLQLLDCAMKGGLSHEKGE